MWFVFSFNKVFFDRVKIRLNIKKRKLFFI